MTSEIPDERVEQAVRGDADVQRDAVEEILHESEVRIAEATQSTAPGDAADEHRRSEDTADS